jgi:hypothetical protein
MAVTLDTTVAGPSANSYVSQEDADDYYAADPIFDSVWGALNSDTKNQWLISAGRALDRFQFIGSKYKDFDASDYQSMQFPRDVDVSTTEIHPNVVRSQLEILKYLYYNIDSSTGQSNLTQELKKIGVYQTVDIEYKDNITVDSKDARRVAGASIEAVYSLLNPWMDSVPGYPSTFCFVR